MRTHWISVAALVIAAVWGCEHDPEMGCEGNCADAGVGGGSGSGGGAGASGSGNQAGADAGADADAAPPCPVIDPNIVTPAIPCEIDAILEAKCRRCHQDPPLNSAPFPLLTWENTQAEYFDKPIHERMFNAVSTGFMPYMGSNPPLDPPVEPLTESEKTTLLDWLDDCAPPVEQAVCP